MGKMKFKLNQASIGQLMKSAGMQSVLTDHASAIKQRCGEGYGQDIYVGKTRTNAMVYAETFKARQDNMKNNTILKAVR